MDPSFRSPLTGLPYVSLADVFPSLPDEGVRIKLSQNALNEIREREKPNIGPWDVVWVALINRQIEVLEKAKSMLIGEKFYIRHHGNPNVAVNLQEFEIIPNIKGESK